MDEPPIARLSFYIMKEMRGKVPVHLSEIGGYSARGRCSAVRVRCAGGVEEDGTDT